MPPVVISKAEKTVMYAITILADVLQFAGIETIVGGSVVDLIIGPLLAVYAMKRKLLTANKALVLAATFTGEIIPGVNMLPFWTFDLRSLYNGTVSELLPEEPEEGGPLNKNGVRKPSTQSTPLNKNGMRLPQKV